ncbi:MAG: MotA/TolQ/ExbB proton channel family protein [Mariniblastus sp.]|nr:MotA/TolQ/ExbB proton channel family protein [Mariniblastus sp.]MDG2180884.1 MotA/TolQ/ExbB proton channel family protein [Mariniblastus sp.]
MTLRSRSLQRGLLLRVSLVVTLFAIASCGDLSAQEIGSGFEMPEPAVEVADSNSRADAIVDSGSSSQVISGTRRLTDIVKSGGPLMIPIGICSFILVVFVFERLIGLRKGRIIPGPFTKRFLEQLRDGDLDREMALQLCERDKSPMANVFKAGVLKWGRSAVEIEQSVLDEGERSSNHLRRYLRLINGVATVCPLLGLLGTVLGMIHAFDSIATVSSATTDPKALIATGISQALLTTAAGLSVAIPALIAYIFFCSRVDKHVMEIDELGMKVVNLISAEAILERDPARQAA